MITNCHFKLLPLARASTLKNYSQSYQLVLRRGFYVFEPKEAMQVRF